MTQLNLNPIDRASLFNSFCDLIDICDGFDQLGKLAAILDQLYSPTDIEYMPLFSMLEMTARHLKNLPNIGISEAYACHSIPGSDQGTVGLCGASYCRCKEELKQTGIFGSNK